MGIERLEKFSMYTLLLSVVLLVVSVVLGTYAAFGDEVGGVEHLRLKCVKMERINS